MYFFFFSFGWSLLGCFSTKPLKGIHRTVVSYTGCRPPAFLHRVSAPAPPRQSSFSSRGTEAGDTPDISSSFHLIFTHLLHPPIYYSSFHFIFHYSALRRIMNCQDALPHARKQTNYETRQTKHQKTQKERTNYETHAPARYAEKNVRQAHEKHTDYEMHQTNKYQRITQIKHQL